MRDWYARLKENKKERMKRVRIILICGITLGFLLWNRELIDGGTGETGWMEHLLFAVLALLPVFGAVIAVVRIACAPEEKKIRTIGWRQLVYMVLNSVWLFFMMEWINNKELAAMKWYYSMLNVGVICVFCILLSLLLNSLKRAMVLINIFYFCLSLVFYYVYLFRGEAFQLIDLYSLGTAADVVGGYTFTLTREIVAAAVGMMFATRLWLSNTEYCFAQKKLRNRILVRIVALALMIGSYTVYMYYNWNYEFGIISNLWNPAKTYREYGTTVGFLAVAKYMRLTPPDHYSVSEVEEIGETLEAEREADVRSDQANGVTPVNIIAVMNESWFDYRNIGDPMTSVSYMPYLDSVTENIIKGHTLVCTKGGGTAKTEYEFLTGNSCKRFPGMVPYVSYFTHDQYSLVTTLKDQGYRAIAMHPNKATNWKRTTAYRFLDFDDFIAIDQFDGGALRYRNMISDMANYEKIIETYEQKEPGSPLFLFDVTMQNHSGYTNKSFAADVNCEGYDSDEADQYFSLLKLSDEAIEYLLTYFSGVEEPTMIVMFGDHSPKLPDEFETWIAGEEYGKLSIEEQEKFYGTPFFIWTNYDMESEENVWISTNYLSSYLLGLTGLALTPYNEYLLTLRQEIPALNHLGCLLADGTWTRWEDADPTILEKERQYECLQYNELMDNDRVDGIFRISR